MATRTETQFGVAKDLGATYTLIGTVTDKLNLLLHVTSLLTATKKFRAYVADASWTTGEPTGSTKVAAIALDLPIAAADVVQISGIILTNGQKLVVWGESAGSFDVIASGVGIV